MKSPRLAQKVDSLLRDLESGSTLSFDLGIPELQETGAFHELISIGPEVVPHLLDRLQGNASKKLVAYIVLALNRIGDIRALAPLSALQARYQEREMKDEWDFAVIGQCNLAIKQLQEGML